jgi:cytochrome c oxidase assembly protein subunit 15
MHSVEYRNKKAVAWWLIAGVIMIIIQTLLGGVTRLTGSGLSITEWKPIMGAMPPTSEQEWNKAFDGYKQIAQYKYMNSDFSLSDFKFIFFWEWLHRLWARLLGVVFAIGFVYFLVKKYFDKEMVRPLVILFILGAAQGLIGWIMVASGLNDTNLYVDHIKLAMHFVAAMILACYTLWFALKLLIPEERRVDNKGLRNFMLMIIILLFIQLTYGAFMAGLKAAMTAATWPTINGMWIPDGMAQHSWVSDKINVHFIHRGLAYVLFVLIIMWFVKARKAYNNNSVAITAVKWWPLILVVTQVVLGILTVVSAPMIHPGKFGTFEALAETHQLVAMFLLMSLVVSYYVVSKPKR